MKKSRICVVTVSNSEVIQRRPLVFLRLLYSLQAGCFLLVLTKGEPRNQHIRKHGG